MHGDFDSIFCVHTYEYNLKENDVIMMYMTSLHVQHILWYLFMHVYANRDLGQQRIVGKRICDPFSPSC